MSEPTLIRFLSLHFAIPFGLIGIILFHLTLLHSSGSGNPLGLEREKDIVSFHPFFSWKDVVGLIVIIIILFSFLIQFPDILMDPDNFSEANPLVTPPHIQPEWYFLFAYSILRAIPRKLGGVVALILSILILIILPFRKSKRSRFRIVLNLLF